MTQCYHFRVRKLLYKGFGYWSISASYLSSDGFRSEKIEQHPDRFMWGTDRAHKRTGCPIIRFFMIFEF